MFVQETIRVMNIGHVILPSMMITIRVSHFMKFIGVNIRNPDCAKKDYRSCNKAVYACKSSLYYTFLATKRKAVSLFNAAN